MIGSTSYVIDRLWLAFQLKWDGSDVDCLYPSGLIHCGVYSLVDLVSGHLCIGMVVLR